MRMGTLIGVALFLWALPVQTGSAWLSVSTPSWIEGDLNKDGIPDAFEQQLAERFAPIVLLDPNEPNLPSEVPSFWLTPPFGCMTNLAR